MGIAAKKGFDPDYNERIRAMGLGGANMQNQFTIACLLTHRRVWQQMVASSVSVRSCTLPFIPQSDRVRSVQNTHDHAHLPPCASS